MVRLRPVAVIPLLVLGACDAMPARVRTTPELHGRLTRSGSAVRDAALRVAVSTGATPDSAVCRGRGSEVTEDDGTFRVSSLQRWEPRGDSLASMAPNDSAGPTFTLCVQLQESQPMQPLFRAPAARWDTLQLACDLDGAWQAPSRDGSEGRCVIVRAALEHQSVAGVGTSSPALVCDTTTTRIDRLRIGPLRVNGSIAELRRVCPGLRDTVVEDESLLGPTTVRAHVLNIAGSPVVIGRASGIITTLTVTSPALRTADSIGVGTRVSRLIGSPDLHVVGASANYGPFAFAWHGSECGLAYSLSRRAYDQRDRAGQPIPVARMRTWPETTSIRRVIVGVCPDREFGHLLR